MLFKNSTDPTDDISSLAEFTKDHTSVRGRATAYVCADFHCELPTNDIDEARLRLENNGSRPT